MENGSYLCQIRPFVYKSFANHEMSQLCSSVQSIWVDLKSNIWRQFINQKVNKIWNTQSMETKLAL